jgi:hypothetical protein
MESQTTEKKATVDIGSEEPEPITPEPTTPKKYNMKRIILYCLLVLLGAGLAYWAVITLW